MTRKVMEEAEQGTGAGWFLRGPDGVPSVEAAGDWGGGGHTWRTWKTRKVDGNASRGELPCAGKPPAPTFRPPEAAHICFFQTHMPKPTAPTVLLTGFGPFANFPVNPSWEAVKLLHNETIAGARLSCHQLVVEYDAVSTEVPALWSSLSPCLVIHVGVSAAAKGLVLEQCGRSRGYWRLDFAGRRPPQDRHPSGGPTLLRTSLDAGLISDAVATEAGMHCSLSSDAGRYLCDFSLYTSLHYALHSAPNAQVLFVHIGPANAPYSKEEVAAGLRIVVKAALAQIHDTQPPKKRQKTQQ